MELAIPTLHDDVIALRPPGPADVDAIYADITDPDIGKFTAIPWPYERHHAVTWVDETTRKWADGTGAGFLTVDAATDELLGGIGFPIFDPENGLAEVGYWVKKEARGRGIAPRAVVLASTWIVGDLGFGRVELQTDVRNHASQRVAEKAGYRREGEVDPPERCRERSERMVMFSLGAEATADR